VKKRLTINVQSYISNFSNQVFHLRRLLSNCKLLGLDVTIQLVYSPVLSRLEYCNGIIASVPVQRSRLVRLVNDLEPFDHVTLALKDIQLFIGCRSSVSAPPYLLDTSLLTCQTCWLLVPTFLRSSLAIGRSLFTAANNIM